ncbi:MAG TPA: DUF2157 domain-containing protein [Clostridiales bacterium]|nr:DUF2157 domain-containing protein [Clostridiales bacterium]
MIKISSNIKKFRTEKGITQDILAQNLQVTRQTISSWETSRTQPDYQMLEKIAEIFEISIEELIYGKNNKIGLEPPKKDNKKLFITIFSILGTLLIAGGIALLFYSLWDTINGLIKTVLAFIPLLVGVGFEIFVSKKKTGAVWNEIGAVVWSIGIIVTNAFLNSIYYAQLGFEGALVLDTIAVIPVILITHGILPMTFYFCGLSYSFLSLLSYSSLQGGIIYSVLFGILIFVGVLLAKKCGQFGAKKHFYAITFATIFLNFTAVIYFISTELNYCLDGFAIFIITGSIFAALMLIDKDERKEVDCAFFSRLGLAASITITTVFALIDGNPYFYPGNTETAVYGSVFITLISLLLILGGVIKARKNLKKFGVSWILIATTILLNTFITFFPSNIEDNQVLIFALCGISAITFIVEGALKTKMSTINFGLIMIAVLVIVLVVGTDLEFVTQGVIMIVVGITLLLANRIMFIKFNKKTADKEIPEELSDREGDNNA